MKIFYSTSYAQKLHDALAVSSRNPQHDLFRDRRSTSACSVGRLSTMSTARPSLFPSSSTANHSTRGRGRGRTNSLDSHGSYSSAHLWGHDKHVILSVGRQLLVDRRNDLCEGGGGDGGRGEGGGGREEGEGCNRVRSA